MTEKIYCYLEKKNRKINKNDYEVINFKNNLIDNNLYKKKFTIDFSFKNPLFIKKID